LLLSVEELSTPDPYHRRIELTVKNAFESGRSGEMGGTVMLGGCEAVRLMAMDQDRVKRLPLALMALSAPSLLPRGYLHSNMCSVCAPHLEERGPMVARHTV
jgi:hypothetical protein